MIYKLSLKNNIDGLTQRTWTFKPPVVMGREPGSGVCIDHNSISRKHCQFTLNGEGALVVKDLESLNGVYVDDNRVRQTILMPHQIIQIGALRLQVEFSTEDELAAVPRQIARGSLDTTQPMKTFQFDQPSLEKSPAEKSPAEKSWWRRLFE